MDMHIGLWISMIKQIQLFIPIITHVQLRISILQKRYIHNSIMVIHNYRVCSLALALLYIQMISVPLCLLGRAEYRLNTRADHRDGCHTDQVSNVTMLKVTKQLCHMCSAILS